MDSNTKLFDVFGSTLKISADSPAWLDEITRDLVFSETQLTLDADLIYNLYLARSAGMDDLIPLPGNEAKYGDSVILVDPPFPFTLYINGLKKWVDYQEYGRVFIDYEKGTVQAAVNEKIVLNQFYVQILFFLNPLSSLLQRAGFFDVHASCAVLNGQGIIFTGQSGRGKSTAALAFLKNGFLVLADEKILLYKRSDAFQAAALSSLYKVKTKALGELFPGWTPPCWLGQVEDEHYFSVKDYLGGRYIGCVPVGALVILEQTGMPQTEIEPVSPLKVIGELFPVSLRCFEPENMHRKFDFLTDFLGQIPCWRVFFGTDMDQFTGKISQILGG